MSQPVRHYPVYLLPTQRYRNRPVHRRFGVVLKLPEILAIGNTAPRISWTIAMLTLRSQRLRDLDIGGLPFVIRCAAQQGRAGC